MEIRAGVVDVKRLAKYGHELRAARARARKVAALELLESLDREESDDDEEED